MLDVSELSSRYTVRRMSDSDVDDILAFCLQNTQFYRYCGRQPSKEGVRRDLHITPPGMDLSSKYYVGFYDGSVLVAIMDLINGYPSCGTVFLGFFMMNKQLQGKGTGTAIIQELCCCLKRLGIKAVQLGIDKENPQSNHFWKKNGFVVEREVEQDDWTVLVAEKTL